jgi:hypothetical protein
MRGDNRRLLDTWRRCEVDTDTGRLEYTVFPGPVPFVGCTRLDGVPIAPTDAQKVLAQLGHEHATMKFMGDGSIRPTPRLSM